MQARQPNKIKMGKRHYKIVFVLAAAVKKDSDGNFVLAERDKSGPLLGEWRLKAVQKILEEKMADKIVIVGYKEKIGEEGVWRCEVMRDILMEKYNIKPELVYALQQKENATTGNVRAIIEYLKENEISSRECAFLTNFYHIPRAIVEFDNENFFLRPLIAELFFVPEQSNVIQNDYGKTEFAFFDRLIKEMNGIKDWEFGTHK